ncbi:MAG: alpha-ketoglutarate-dependent dioxygenase AlkB family protein [Tamlana sp.]
MLFRDPVKLDMIDADVVYYPNFFNKNDADKYFNSLLDTVNWAQDSITVFGKTHLQPRLTAFYAQNNNPYKYSNIVMVPNLFEGDLLKIKNTVENEIEISFTSCLANLYRNGKDSNSWHADNEKELGERPIIASVSFGAERIFHFKHRFDKTQKAKLTLNHGSLLLMKGETQKNWLHQIPKTKRTIGKRVNLTFRIIE